MAFETAATIITDSANELGLYAGAIADPYASTDPNILKLTRYLKRVGRKLLRSHPWSHLQTIYTFPTVASTASYALPTDFNRIVDGTAWNRTQQLPMWGPLSPQAWQAEKARGNTTTAHQFFRIFGNLFYIHATPSAAETIAYEYISRYWVDLGGGSVPDSETPSAAADTLFFDPDLLVAALNFAFLKRSGMPSADAQAEFEEAWANATNGDSAAPVLSLSGGGGGFRPLDGLNLPDTGFGD